MPVDGLRYADIWTQPPQWPDGPTCKDNRAKSMGGPQKNTAEGMPALVTLRGRKVLSL